MTEPCQHIFGMIDLCPVWNGGTVYHQHQKTELSCGKQLRLRAVPPGVFAHHKVDGMVLHQLVVSCDREGAATHDQPVTGQGWRVFRGVHEAQQIIVLRLGGERFHMHPSQCQHDAAGWPVQRGNGAVNVLNAGPAILGCRFPGGTGQRNMGDARQPGRFDGMTAHRRGKGMRRVNQMSHALAAQIVSQPGNAAKAADTYRHWLGARGFCTASITERRRNALSREQPGERTGLRRSAQQEDVWHG